jgi:hypothetical protein
MDHHDVERVAIVALGRRHEPPVMGIDQPGQQGFAEGEGFKFRIIGEFGAAAAGCLDNDMYVAVFRKGGRLKKFGMAYRDLRVPINSAANKTMPAAPPRGNASRRALGNGPYAACAC